MKKKQIIPAIKFSNNIMSGGFSSLTRNQMVEINGSAPPSNSQCGVGSGPNSYCNNTADCAGSNNTSCTNQMRCVRNEQL